MANISFANMDQAFSSNDLSLIEYSSTDTQIGTLFSYLTTGGDDWEVHGSGFTYAGGLPTAGTVTGVDVDLDNDGGGLELVITGLSLSATSLGVGIGADDQQRDKFWAAVLGGADTFDFNMASFANTIIFAGDGANISDGGLHRGTSETFLDPGQALGGASQIFGDFLNVSNGIGLGGDDDVRIGARDLFGDFKNISSLGTGIGGNDIIRPVRVDSNVSGAFFGAYGDGNGVSGALFAGDDLIDLRNTDFTGSTVTSTELYGDASGTFSTGALIGGNDTIHGSSFSDSIYGDYLSNAGYVEGGKDRLFGYGGNDAIFGNEGRDQLYGGDGDDSLNGGLDGDIIDGGIGDDFMIGDTGNDIMLGGDGNDTMLGGSGRDTIDGGVGDDASDAGAGTDVMIGGTGKDSLFGGSGNDTISGDGGNDTLQGGDDNDLMTGGAGFDVLLGGNGDDTLDGGASNDILLGNAGNDRFIFSLGSSTDTIRDFVAGAGVADVINLVGFGAAFDTFAEVMAAATDNGTDTTINFGGGDVLIIQNVTVAQFNTDDFIFG